MHDTSKCVGNILRGVRAMVDLSALVINFESK